MKNTTVLLIITIVLLSATLVYPQSTPKETLLEARVASLEAQVRELTASRNTMADALAEVYSDYKDRTKNRLIK